jgi:hypothetical protein
MILDVQNQKVEVEEIGSSFKNKKAKITEKNTPYIFQLLANIYSNPVGSIVREITSNCFDGFVALNKALGLEDKSIKPDQIVFVRLYIDDTGQRYIEFVDQGVGISEINMDEIYMSYGESDKRDSDDFIGAFGLGSKSPFSYSDYFHVITKHAGIESNYLIYSTSLGPEYDCLLRQEITDGSTGTIVRVPIKADYVNEKGQLVEEVKVWEKNINEQLKYFKNVFVLNFTNVKNDYKIIQFDSFQIREDSFLEKKDLPLHLVLGDVTYPIRFAELGEEEIKLNAALKFPIGALDITPNREELKYTPKTKKLMLEVLEQFKAEIKTLVLNPENFKCDNLLDFRTKSLKLKDKSLVNNNNLLPGHSFDLNLNDLKLTKEGTKFTMLLDKDYYLINPVELNPNDSTKILLHWGSSYYGSKLTLYNEKTAKKKLSVDAFEKNDKKYVIINKDKLKKYERSFLNDKRQTDKVVKISLTELYKKQYQYFIKHNPGIDKDTLRAIIKDFKEKYENEVLNKNFVTLESLAIPENYGKTQRVKGDKTSISSTPLNGKILYFEYDGGYFRRNSRTLTSFQGLKDTILVYGTQDDKYFLELLYSLFNTNTGLSIVWTASKNCQTLKTLPFSFNIRDIMREQEDSQFYAQSMIKKHIKELINFKILTKDKDKYKPHINVSSFSETNLELKEENHLNLPNVVNFIKLIRYFYNSKILNVNVNESMVKLLSRFLSEKYLTKQIISKEEKINIFQQYANFTKDFYLELEPLEGYWGWKKGNQKYTKTITAIQVNLELKLNKLNRYIKNTKIK